MQTYALCIYLLGKTAFQRHRIAVPSTRIYIPISCSNLARFGSKIIFYEPRQQCTVWCTPLRKGNIYFLRAHAIYVTQSWKYIAELKVPYNCRIFLNNIYVNGHPGTTGREENNYLFKCNYK